MVKKPEEFVDLFFGKVGVVGYVFYFERVSVLSPSGHNVGERVEAWIAHWNPNGVVSFFLEEFHKYSLAIETSFTPAPKSYPINFFTQKFPLNRQVLNQALDIKIIALKNADALFGRCYCILL